MISIMEEKSQESVATEMYKLEGDEFAHTQTLNVISSNPESPMNNARRAAPAKQPKDGDQGYLHGLKQGDIVRASAAQFVAENKRRKLYEKMGYIVGTPLGPRRGDEDSCRLVDPPKVIYRTGSVGLGSEEASIDPLQEQHQHQSSSGRQKEGQEPQEQEQEETHKEEQQANEAAEFHFSAPTAPTRGRFRHPFSIQKLRNPEFHPYSVQIGETIVTSRRDHIALVRLGQLLKAYIKSHNDGSLSADAYNEILHRCISIVLRFRNERYLQRNEEGVVINEFSDETLQALIATQYLRKTARMAKHKKACGKQKGSN
ncbi:squalene synthetase-like protein [Rhizina undulata]